MNITPTDSPTEPSSPPPLPAGIAKKKRVPVLIWVILGISLLLNLFWFQDSLSFGFMEVGARQFPAVEAQLAWGAPDAQADVAVLRLSGVILDEETQTFFGAEPSPVAQLIAEIQAVTMDESYRAILLKVDSPGGGVTASDEIYRALMAFKESDPDRKIVAHVEDMAASGGYYAALAADKIVAQPTSLVGSIGVMISAVNLHKLGEKLGIEDVTLASSDNKALLNALDPVDPEHTEILQDVVDDMYDRFRGLVLEHRPFTEAYADEHNLLDGRVFTLPAAQKLGLVDRVGYEDVSRDAVEDLLGVDSAAYYDVSYMTGGFSWFSAKAPQIQFPRLRRARLMYVWTP